MAQRSLAVAYLLWLLGGCWGLHHIYLNRPEQAFLWTISGACLGFGWLRDMLSMPDYVEQANGSDYFAKNLAHRMSVMKVPPFAASRVVAALIFGQLFATASENAIPFNLLPEIFHGGYIVMRVLGAALGVWFVGQVPVEQKGSLTKTLLGAAAGQLLGEYTVVGAISSFMWFRSFRRSVRANSRGGCCRALFRYTILCTAALLVAGSGVYWHGKISINGGETFYVRDSIQNLLKSEFFRDFNYTEFFENARQFEWEQAGSNFGSAMDPQGERRAYRTLGVAQGAGMAEVKKAHRKIVLANHPDKVTGTPEEVAAAEQRFIEAQAAYETLKEIHEKRTRHDGGGRGSRNRR